MTSAPAAARTRRPSGIVSGHARATLLNGACLIYAYQAMFFHRAYLNVLLVVRCFRRARAQLAAWLWMWHGLHQSICYVLTPLPRLLLLIIVVVDLFVFTSINHVRVTLLIFTVRLFLLSLV